MYLKSLVDLNMAKSLIILIIKGINLSNKKW